MHVSFRDNNGYIRTAVDEPKAWLFSIKPNNPDKVEIAKKFNSGRGSGGSWRAYYGDNPNYLMCMGGGHDLCCRGYDGHCWSDAGHDYRPPVSGSYNSLSWQRWLSGAQGWNGRNDRDIYEVYRVIK